MPQNHHNMNKKLLLVALALVSILTQALAQTTRYVDRVFPSSQISRTQRIMYADGYSVLTGSPKLDTLYMDVYQPTGDAVTARPLIIYCHTGSFLPRYINQLATGARDDSATVEMCTQFARRGYVVASISYRLGWNPQGSTEEIRKETIINAAYRGVQDLSAAIRYFKKNVYSGGNTYGVDTTKICVGGQGTGGYITMAYATIDKQEEIKIDKFYNFTNNRPMVNDTLWGDRMGFAINAGSVLSRNNHPGHTSSAQVAFNVGGALGDTSWLEAGEIPIISVHGIYDPFAPYKTGIVKVPGTNFNVVEVSGGYDIMKRENEKGNNNVYKGKVYDVYTQRANILNEGLEGLFPVDGLANGSGPWEWWDSTYLRGYLTASGMFTQAQITTINRNSSLSNPLMSKSRALLYIDTVGGYLAPRIAVSLGLVTSAGINKLDLGSNVTIAPVPAIDQLIIHNNWSNHELQNVQLTDVTGRVVMTSQVNQAHHIMPLNVPSGIYYVNMQFNDGMAVRKIVVR